jgi:hypothetical protein
MRFIDMFMAALGALVFMAMLLAFLLGLVPPNGVVPPPPPDAKPLQILTRTLPPARAGEPYEVALAYRGGTGAVVWEVAAGAQEIPTGIKFDAAQGVLSGTPAGTGKASFVIRIHDSARTTHERPFELMIEPPLAKDSGKIGKWLAVIVFAGTLLVWLTTRGFISQLKHQVTELKAAWQRGEPYVIWETGQDVLEQVDLPGGIDTYQARLRGTQQFSRVVLVFLLIEAVFFAWRFWLAGS